MYVQVRLPSMNDKVALVPWADMLNHSCEVESFFSYLRCHKHECDSIHIVFDG